MAVLNGRTRAAAEAVADGFISRLISRVSMALMLPLGGLLAWFIVDILTDIRGDTKAASASADAAERGVIVVNGKIEAIQRQIDGQFRELDGRTTRNEGDIRSLFRMRRDAP